MWAESIDGGPTEVLHPLAGAAPAVPSIPSSPSTDVARIAVVRNAVARWNISEHRRVRNGKIHLT
jgi:hypothetical protein